MEGTLGEIRLFGGNFAPRNWAFCQGQILDQQAYQGLFELIGNTYGSQGSIMFKLPDLRGLAVVGPGSPPHATAITKFVLGTPGGSQTQTIAADQLPVNQSGANTTATTAATADSTDKGSELSTDATQQQQPLLIMQPYLPMNYIICINGNFPETGD